MSNELTTAPQTGLVSRFADKYGVAPEKLLTTLKATAFKVEGGVTNEQMMALLVVADQYSLNPFTKEIFAFVDKHKGVVPIVSVDGWTRIINSHPAYDGIEFNYSEKLVTMPDGKPCPEWCEVTIYRKDRTRPTIVREYLDEVYIGKRNNYAGPWQSHTKRFLRHKTLIQGARIAFGFAGIYDEDEGMRIIDAHAIDSTSRKVEIQDLGQQLRERASIEHVPAQPDPPADMDPATGEVVEPIPTREVLARIESAQSKEEVMELKPYVAAIPDDQEREHCAAVFDERLLSFIS